MSKFNNYNTDILDQINELDEKLVEVINVVKQLSNRLKKLEDIAAKLEESGNATATQIELNRKREAELTRQGILTFEFPEYYNH